VYSAEELNKIMEELSIPSRMLLHCIFYLETIIYG